MKTRIDISKLFEKIQVGLVQQSSPETPLKELLRVLKTWFRDPLSDVLSKEMQRNILNEVKESFPGILSVLETDALAALHRDPAAKSLKEVILTYPGFSALIGFRTAHLLDRLGVTVLPRFISSYVITKTGIDIHPSAEIGPGCFIDHGNGVVIGETAVLGSNVTLYHGVTLGAKSIPKVKTPIKRHPTLKNGVTVYAGAFILGGDTIIGENSVIGSRCIITKSIPANSKITFSSEGGFPNKSVVPTPHSSVPSGEMAPAAYAKLLGIRVALTASGESKKTEVGSK